MSSGVHTSPPAPPTACTLAHHDMPPQPFQALDGFLGGPLVFVKRDPEDTAATQRAVVSLSPAGSATTTLLPEAFSDQVWVTSSHTLLVRFSVETQKERLVVLPRGRTDVLGELEGIREEEVRDVVDGAPGESLVALATFGAIGVARVDRAGRPGEPVALVTHHRARRLKLARERADHGLVVVWTEQDARDTPTSLWLARVREDGGLREPPVVIDSAPAPQPVADVAVVDTPDGAVVAWNPIVSQPEQGGGPHDVQLGVALRVYRARVGTSLARLAEVPLTTWAGPIASVGGFVLENHLRAVPLGDDALLTWIESGHRFATLALHWKPLDIGLDDKDGLTSLVSLGQREAAYLWTSPGDGDPWPTLRETRLACGSPE